MTKLQTRFRKATSILLSALMSVSVFSFAAAINASAVSYSEMSALDSQAYSGSDLGAVYSKTSTTFKVWSPTASKVQIKRYTTGSDAEAGASVIETKDMTKGSQGIWSITIQGDLNKTYYTYLVTNNGVTKETVDIYARTTGVNGMRGMVVDLDSTDPAGWENDKRISCPNQTDSIIWEVHVRDFSSSSDSGMTNKGKFLAFTETGTTVNGDGQHPTGIDYLADLGVTHVHLLPVFDFDGEIDETNLSADKFNWGYDPVNYNAPEGSYSTDPYHGEVRIKEFKQMVQALHNKGIGVVMDVVYNHTYGKNDWFDFTVPDYYYRQDSTGKQSNGSGCGNETASDRAMYRKYMIDSLTYWATEYHLDGFRFDLMGLHDCETMNQIRTAMDAIDPDIILYGEPWYAEPPTCPTPTAVQGNMNLVSTGVGAFNDRCRDAIKGSCFVASDPGFIQGAGFEEALKGSIQANSTDLSGNNKWSKQPSQTVTYTSAHDNYTLYDKLVLTCKGGSGYGSRFDDLVAMNKLAGGIILTSQGMSFFQAGEEFARSKYGDHNSYKSSTAVNQLKWSNTITYSDLLAYYKGLIEIRKAYSPFRDPTNASNNSIYFSYGSSVPEHVVAFTIKNTIKTSDEWNYVAVIHNANDYSVSVPLMCSGTVPSQWTIIADGSTAGIESLGTTGSTVTVPARSTMVLVDKASFDSTVIASNCTVTVKHIIKTEGYTYKTEVLKGREGASYSTSPLSELLNSGYKVDITTGDTTGTFTKGSTSVAYYYVLDTTKYGTVTVKYQDAESGATLAPDTIKTGLIGSSYSVSPVDVSGYECDPSLTSNATGTFAQGNITVIFKYTESEVENLTVHYYNSNGWSAVAMYVYKGSSPSAVEYAGGWPGTIMTSDSGGWYTGSVNTTDTVLFIANNNNNGEQDPTGVGSSGYSVSGEVWIKGGKVYPTGKVLVKYVDQQGNVLSKETLKGMADGTNTYTTTSKRFDGYELVSSPTNATGVYTSGTITVTYQYKSKVTDPLVNNSSISSGSTKTNTPVTITFSASGGTAPYQYAVYHKLSSASSYTTDKNFASASSYSLSIDTAGSYTVKVTVKDSSGSAKDVTFPLTVTSTNPLVNKTTLSASKVAKNAAVTINFAAAGGTKPYQYCAYYKKSTDSSFTTIQGLSSTTSATFKPTTAGTYTVRTKVKDADKTVEVLDITLKVTNSTPLVNKTTLSATTVPKNTNVTVKFAATGGTKPYQYCAYYKLSSASSYTTIQSLSSSTSATFSLSTAGTYNIRTKVKDADKTVTVLDITLTVTNVTPLVNKTTLSATTVPKNTNVTVKFAATGGTKPYQYCAYYKLDSASSYTTIQSLSSTTSATFKLGTAGTYNIRTKVKDSNHTVEVKDITLKVTAPLTNKSTLSATSITLGESITVNCAAAGGTSPYKYAVYYKKSTDSSYVTKQDFTTNKTVKITPQRAVKYDVVVKVKDAEKTIARSAFTVTVEDLELTNKSTLSASSIYLGESVTVKCAASGGTKPYQYAVSYKKSSSSAYTIKQDYSTNATVKITPQSDTEYTVKISVRDAEGTIKSITKKLNVLM